MTNHLLRLCHIDPPRRPSLLGMVLLGRNASLQSGFASLARFVTYLPVGLIALMFFAVPFLYCDEQQSVKKSVQSKLCSDRLNYGGECLWFTGTLLTPTSPIVQPGYVNIEPFFSFKKTYGQYNHHGTETALAGASWRITPELFIEIGMIKWMDFQCTIEGVYKHKDAAAGNRQHFGFGDITPGFNIVLFSSSDPVIPYIKLILEETFPTGKFRNLNPNMNGTDGVGGGSYTTTASLLIHKLFPINNEHFIVSRLDLVYGISTATHVKGFNVFGGGFGTKARVIPGQFFSVLMAFEYNLTKRWGMAVDFTGSYTAKTRFTGDPGVAIDGGVAVISNNQSSDFGYLQIESSNTGSQTQFVVAPAIEYNIKEHMGIVGGATLSIAGRNSAAFVGGSVAFDYVF